VVAVQQEKPTRPAGSARVLVVGDSLTAQASWAISEDLSRLGHTVAVAGTNGATIGDLDRLVNSYTGYSGAEVMVLAIGTNNAYYARPGADRSISIDETVDDLHEMAKDAIVPQEGRAFALPVRCLVWVGLTERRTLGGTEEHAPAINAAIRAEVAAQTAAGRSMLFADWHRASIEHPAWSTDDGLHLTPAGQDGYAALIAETVANCP